MWFTLWSYNWISITYPKYYKSSSTSPLKHTDILLETEGVKIPWWNLRNRPEKSFRNHPSIHSCPGERLCKFFASFLPHREQQHSTTEERHFCHPEKLSHPDQRTKSQPQLRPRPQPHFFPVHPQKSGQKSFKLLNIYLKECWCSPRNVLNFNSQFRIWAAEFTPSIFLPAS